ncbi:hypothetical protein IV500_05895 [Paeniglutamicibacter antarcticus]|uniref:Uncharacterized protein n=1 Tax=Arthrobacter terrae TaxID=2935737 RepID=A0A931G4Z1_9MICC|nr:hypothetical protein [Arthrobacter terrae]MBG0738955.1 hypothetical protein [Arthrobacter terrae]
MTMNVENRTRVQAGIKAGGQFAAEMHAEPSGVILAQGTSPLDGAAVAAAAGVVRTRAACETGKWQRHQDKAYPYNLELPLPAELLELNRQAKDFESLPRQEQDDLLDQLKLPGVKHLLEPGQKLGNDRVLVADNLDTDGGDIGLALTAQKLIADAQLPGTATLTQVGELSTFIIQDAGIKHDIRVGKSLLSFAADSGKANDYTRDNWLYRADISVHGGSAYDEGQVRKVANHFRDHREYAVMMDVAAGSPFNDSDAHFGEFCRADRTAVIKTDGIENLLDVSGDEPVLKPTDGMNALHPSMVRGFLDHMATQTGNPDRDAFVADLREVFRETDRRLVR